MADRPLLEVKDLVIHYETGDRVAKALNDANIHISVEETLRLVGETGAGKTTLAEGIMRLIPSPPGKILGGEVIFEGQDLLELPTNGMEVIRGRDISMIFQDPMIPLNPVLTVDEQIMEVIENRNTSLSGQEARKQAENMLERVGTPTERFGEYSHQFSGGMKQRIAAAIVLACSPRLLITDEPTTALDATIQTQVLEMVYKPESEDNISMILTTHDLGVVAQNYDYMAIIRAGGVVEHGTLRETHKDTRHPYTEGPFGSIPSLTSNMKWLWVIDGTTPGPTKLPEGYAFYGRYRYVVPECSKGHPGMMIIDGTHRVHCIRHR